MQNAYFAFTVEFLAYSKPSVKTKDSHQEKQGERASEGEGLTWAHFTVTPLPLLTSYVALGTSLDLADFQFAPL